MCVWVKFYGGSKLRLNTVRHVTSIGPSITPVSTIFKGVTVFSKVMYWGKNAASGELKISNSVDLISRLKTWLRYELFDINPVQERRVLGRSSFDSHGEGIAYHSLNKITCNKQSIEGLSE